MKNKLSFYLLKYNYFLYIFILFFSSCGFPIEQEIINNTYFVTNYLTKARYFLLFIIFLLDSGKYHWINLYSRLYYFYFTLARIKCILQQNKLLKNSHTEIWNLSPVESRKIFGEEFKKIRTICDYNIIENEETFIRNTNNIIIGNHKKAFTEQINDIIKYYPKKIGNNDEIDELITDIISKYNIFLDLLKKTNKK